MKKVLAVLFIALGVVVIAFLMKIVAEDKGNGGSSSIIQLSIPQEVSNLTGQLSEATKDMDVSKAQNAIDFARTKESEGSLDTKEGIMNSINEAKDRFGLVISDSISTEIADTVLKLEEMGISSDILIDESDKLIKKYGEDFSDHIEEALVDTAKEAAGKAAEGIWDKFKNAVAGLLSGE